VNHARTFPSRDAAERSKRFLAGGLEAVYHEPCDGWHLQDATPRVMPKRGAQRAATFPPRVAAAITRRDRCCQRCGATSGLHRHHRRGKSRGGPGRRAHAHCACNGILACFLCHAWIHAHPRQAAAEGFIVSQAVDEPATVSVMRYAATGSGATQWPTCGGEWAATEAEAAEAVA
jgi:hypothetical protein